MYACIRTVAERQEVVVALELAFRVAEGGSITNREAPSRAPSVR
jgi:hypothetical protein